MQEGTRLGPYEVVAPIGAGGMGEVWRGRDTRLGRDVAIKVLPAQFAQSAQFKIRFEREAKAISSLNHPNICTLFDVGESNVVGSTTGETLHYIVMELIEGESLAERIAKGPMPLDQVLRYGAQVADALQRAHRQGIIHRDLKPGNIMITKSGAKLLDFGLARTSPETGPLGGMTQIPTEAHPVTQEGTIVGTFQYMAPEQLEGVEADARTDIFAFGAVLYEMATGRRAFQGQTRSSLIAAIVSSMPPPVGEIIPLTPPALEHVIRKCLAKDPDERWQSAHDIADQLRWILEAGSRAGEAAPVVARRKSRLYIAWGLHAVTALVAVALTAAVFQVTRSKPAVIASSLLPPLKSTLDISSGAMSVSPDGSKVAFVARSAEGTTALWIRPVSALTAQPLAGTDGARFPFWSPDSGFIGFFSSGKLRKIASSGGPPQAICEATDGRGGSWSDDGESILFAPSTSEPIHRVAASGGVSAAVTQLASDETSHRFPEFLPDGKSFLYLSESGSDNASKKDGFAVYAATLGSKTSKLVVASNASARYSRTGHVLFFRDATLLAQRFDPDKLQLTGEAVPLAENVTRSSRFEAIFSVSRNGLLAFQSGEGSQNSQLLWMDREGRETEASARPADMRDLSLSSNGKKVACAVFDTKVQKSDIWVIDLERGTSTRLTFDPGDDSSPLWSHDDRYIYFTSQRSGRGDIYRKAASGTGVEELISSTPERDLLRSLAADGRTGAVMVNNIRGKTGWDIGLLDMASKKITLLVATPFVELYSKLSEDGRWLAYTSSENGREEVYVLALGDSSGKWQISTDGGSRPEWTKQGRELIFAAPGGKLMAVDVTVSPEFSASVPQPLFEPKARRIPGRQVAVSADGSKFLVNRTLDETAVEPMTLVQNWDAALKK